MYKQPVRCLGLLVLLASSSSAQDSNRTLLKHQIDNLQRQTQATPPCSPTSRESIHFCTSLTLSKSQAQSLLSLDRAACLKKISHAGYQIADNNQGKQIPENEWETFSKSLSRARTFQDSKIVAFKPGTGRVDCIHELVHVLQWTNTNETPGALSPKKSNLAIAQASESLNHEIDRIAELERQGNTATAKTAATDLQPSIDVVRKFSDLIEDFEEIDAHYFIFSHCSELKCSEDDQDLALANLLSRSPRLSPESVTQLQKRADQRRTEKLAPHLLREQKSWHRLKNTERTTAQSLLKKDWPELIADLRATGLRIVGLQSAQAMPKLSSSVPFPIFQELSTVTLPESEQAALLGSRITQGTVLGKFVCQAAGKPTLYVTSAATKGTFVHEYLHFKQSQKNSDYCPAVSDQGKIARQFAQAQINRHTYETTILRYQAINAVAEHEVYQFMIDQGALLDHLEQLNNREMLLKYPIHAHRESKE